MNADDELTAEEKSALAALASDGTVPPPALEDAVVTRLSSLGLVSARRRSWKTWAFSVAAAAAGIALFAAGIAVGQRRGQAAPPGAPAAAAAAMPRFVLLLYDAPGEETMSAAEMASRVDEYRNWAIGLRRSGSDISGEKLAPGRLDLGAAGVGPGPRPLGGYFVFSARDREAALAIARSCPHLRHGGLAELRPIEET